MAASKLTEEAARLRSELNRHNRLYYVRGHPRSVQRITTG